MTRNLIIERFSKAFYVSHEASKTDAKAYLLFIVLGLCMVCAVYFSLKDIATTSISIACTPYLIVLVEEYTPASGILANGIFLHIILTAVLKLILMLTEKLGVLDWIAAFCGKYFCSFLYMPLGMLIMLTLPFLWPVYIIVLIIKASKKNNSNPQ